MEPRSFIGPEDLQDSHEDNLFLIEGDRLFFLVFIWMYINVLFAAPPISYHLVTGFVMLLAAVRLFKNSIKLNYKILSICILSILIPSIYNRDIKGFLAGASLFVGIASYFILFYDKNINIKTIVKIFLFVIIPGYLISTLVIGEGARSALQVNPSTLIPLDENMYKINIGPWGTTVHFSAEIAFLAGLSSLFTFIKEKNRPVYLAVALFSLYLIIFSGARSIYFSILSVLLVLIFYKMGLKRLIFVLILFLAVVVYFTGMYDIGDLQLVGVAGDLTRLNGTSADLSNGRAWLWELHLNQFFQHPIFGIGRNGVDDLFKNWNLANLPATSESVYTAQLAMYGIFGLSYLFFQIHLVKKIIKNDKLELILLATHMFIITVENGIYGNITVLFLILVMSVFASALRGRPFILEELEDKSINEF